VPAGRITWTRGWSFLLVFTLLMASSIAYFTRANPEIFAVRSRVHPGTKRWDKIMICLLFVAILAIPPVAGLDDGPISMVIDVVVGRGLGISYAARRLDRCCMGADS
jgi:hypothetical protein